MKNSRRKTYGVFGLVEWYCSIPCGEARVDIPFVGGSVSGNGTIPAQYTTENPVVQVVIENSEFFRRGRIVLISDIEGSGRFKIADNTDAPAENPAQSADTEEQDEEGDTVKKTQVKVSSVEDAKDYLVDKFGIASSKLRTRAACIAAGEENGVEFIWS